LVKEPTRHDRIIDLIITNADIALSTFVDEPGFYLTDHLMTTVKIPIQRRGDNFKMIKFRNYKGVDLDLLNNVVENTNFTPFQVFDINDIFNGLTTSIKSVFDEVSPQQERKIAEKDFNFPISDNVKRLKREAVFHYDKWTENKLPFHLERNRIVKK
jgi:hypothetical protein